MFGIGNERKILYINKEKKEYKNFLIPYNQYINFIDFNESNKRFYGIKNEKNLEILPKADKVLIDEEYDITALDFVVIAYRQLVERYFALIKTGQITKKTILSNALSSPFMSQIGLNFSEVVQENKIFFNEYIPTRTDLNKETTNIKDYSYSYAKNVSLFKTPILTHMKYYNINSIRNISGLTISLVNLPLNNDQEKVDFILDKNFLVLRKLAEQYGFYIDQNIPWQLTANIAHPNIKSIISKKYPKDKITTKFILDTYFDILLFVDYEVQKEFLYNCYIDFYGYRPEYSEPYFCERREETLTKIVVRSDPPGTLEEFLKFDELFFLKLYFRMLNYENKIKYDLIQMGKFINDMTAMYQKDLDKKKALLYIYSKFINKLS
jgi:hypothetical protein